MKAPLLLAFLFIFLAANAAPAAAQDLPAQLKRCLTIYGVMERLACYDQVAHEVTGSVPSRPAAPPMPATAAAPAPAPRSVQPPPQAGFGYNGAAPSRQTTPETFGSENIPHPATAAPIDSITAQVISHSFTPQGRFIVTLANGQVWQQIEGDVARPNLSLKHARSATISRGLLGSYNLSFSDQRGRFKVDRVR